METIQKQITEFINHCKYEKNLSSKTIKAYSTDLIQFTTFLSLRNLPLEIPLISKTEIRSYLESIHNLKAKSVKRKIATLKAMFNFLEYEDKITINPFRKMRIKIKEPKVLPKILDSREVNAIFRSAYKKYLSIGQVNSVRYLLSLRDIAVIELLFATGARVSEIANLNIENIDLNSGVITIKGKGNKERIIQICNPETFSILKKYHSNFNEKIKNSGGYFLINRIGKKISDQSIRRIVNNLCSQTRIKKHVTPHVFRHSLATLLLEKEVDIKYIQTLLGHSSIMTTQIYTHVNRKKQREILTRKHPRQDFTIPVFELSMNNG